ncbi:hypothetical protein Tco_0963350, partial [Tanacetum coccineum]
FEDDGDGFGVADVEQEKREENQAWFMGVRKILDRLLSSWDNLGFTNPTLHTIGFSARIMEIGPDIGNMTLNEYLEYKAEKERQSWRNVQSKSSPTRIRAENLRRMGQDKVQNGCDDDTSRDTNHESGNLLNFPIFPATNEFSSICEQDVDLEKEEAQVEDDDDGNIYNICDITVEDVERIRQFLTPNLLVEMDEVIQHLILQPIHTTPPNDDYVAPATKSILNELLKEFGDEILNVTMVEKKADFNPTKDIEELERLLAKDPQSHFMKIQLYRLMKKLDVARRSRLGAWL